MNNYIVVKKEEFVSILSGDRYRYAVKGDPELPWRGAHIKFVMDTVTNTYVGYVQTSSWNPYTQYAIIDTLVSSKIRARVRKEWKKRKKVQTRSKRDFRRLKARGKYVPRKPLNPGKPGLFEFLEGDNMINYNPSDFTFDEVKNILEDFWFNENK